jgi:1-acyl-sn-glycerol-3-phosphate acyltransferase
LKVRRLVRFMAKQEVFEHPVSGPLMRGMKHIPVDRAAGSASYRLALQALRDGEFVGVFPEATISRSFTLKETKNGATRMAMRAGVPLVPVVLWGTQRLMTKGRPTKLRRHVPVVVCIGEPIPYERGDSPDAVHGRLVTAMQRMLDEVQRSYPDSPADDGDRWWLPAHLGGSAPTPEEAAVLDATETASRG